MMSDHPSGTREDDEFTVLDSDGNEVSEAFVLLPAERHADFQAMVEAAKYSDSDIQLDVIDWALDDLQKRIEHLEQSRQGVNADVTESGGT